MSNPSLFTANQTGKKLATAIRLSEQRLQSEKARNNNSMVFQSAFYHFTNLEMMKIP